ncbi:hypothetical protein Pdw03_3750 [Penicillium digitatum]|uniref:Uncharacterized protein n=1 Tax=Penicillium digitatum TaxID=36651 RepID=A0A7T7BII5_PENDI|nr:hypothetical protein Pdw03_3750 [Penicillium digitatum]
MRQRRIGTPARNVGAKSKCSNGFTPFRVPACKLQIQFCSEMTIVNQDVFRVKSPCVNTNLSSNWLMAV